jgi:hypothetical protein
MREHVVREVGKEGLRMQERPFQINDAVDDEVADVELRHGSSSNCWGGNSREMSSGAAARNDLAWAGF